MLADAFMVMVNNLFKEIFYGEKKKAINVFCISHKNGVKTFPK